ncbi:major facilitator superfamily domain-containing protein [Blyttiomyces helicus]|uniref:Major facilitator superfamily domain-containing protein n=1 Tax=Blyttiomyces helicus TaxID=388810 RepID=A0A4P9WPX6_9FUNG|nr:major facilitator superfamily domain-containing protein [Blyttiomyces helicus]|eukprot:RKO93818.1 major facilitator superfamily domain-containing protein [Blyttiomyces helicus]
MPAPTSRTPLLGDAAHRSRAAASRTRTLLALVAIMLAFNTAQNVAPIPTHQFLLDAHCKEHYAENGGAAPYDCRIQAVQSKTAAFVSLQMVLTSITSCFTALILGPLSDRIGRKPVIIFSYCGAAMSFVATYCAATFELSLKWMLLGSLIDGLAGSMTAINTITWAAITDVTTSEIRTFWFGVLMVVARVGKVAGLAIGGLLAGRQDYSNIDYKVYTPAFRFELLSVTLAVAAFALFIPETLAAQNPPKDGLISGSKQAIPRSRIAEELAKFVNVPWAAQTAYLLVGAVAASRASIDFLWTFRLWDWGTTDNSLYTSAATIGSIACCALAPVFQAQLKRLAAWSAPYSPFPARNPSSSLVAEEGDDRRHKWIEEKASTLVMTISVAALAVAMGVTVVLGDRVRWLLYYCVPLASLAPVAQLAGRVILAAAVPASQIGSVSAGISFLSTLAGLVVTQMSAAVYGATVDTAPLAPYYGYTALMLVALCLMLLHNRQLNVAGSRL